MKTLKQLLDQVNGESGFDIPSVYVGSSDPNIIQLVAIANRSAILLRDMHLQYLVKLGTIDLDNGAATDDDRIKSYSLPADFYSIVPDTTYQRGRIDAAEMPTSATTWNYLISRTGPQGLRVRCRFIGGRLEVFSPEAAQTIQFEYLSANPIRPALSDASNISTFTNDGDVWLLDDAIIELDVKWRYKREKGLDWQGDQAIYQTYENALRARDMGTRTIGWPKDWPYPNEPYANLWVA